MKKLSILLFTFFIVSCGSRKVETSINSTEKETETNSNYKFDKLSLEPVDIQKPIIVQGKEYYNTKVIRHYEEGEKIEKAKTEETEKDKKTERDNTMLFIGIALIGAFGFLFMLVILVIGLIIYFRKT
ncbi:hypothetical protein [Flavobacterium phage V157]|uniref:Lipoprotein n=20 Tax=Ficleduovirus TaxID=2560131 RepID=A0A0A0YSY0_9CAUD|nr:hypothetical protein ABG42_gp19 [Flavobacterium phage FCL-2]YP_009591106.1 hypothetical protein FDG55_gp20 [Flavobacterium phage FCV-1]ASD51604.1 hypothetical protein [Flavobacterium phage FCV-3]ASD51678.1 hypothetical protein [Flavobacterium phage FCV-11]ASD51752.1 hypothetical protein [Flavobacterium phage V175]ASD51830.1 hypothetical protein [Flavobacterium phage V181]ASD52508.1 hypothetical protein [Flavobacterium phage FCV-10]ASD52581.1 hypothetical protein [Flavobacterium phage FCV-